MLGERPKMSLGANMFAGLSYEICAAAWNVIIAANIDGVTNKQAGTIVVLYPHTGDVAFMSRLNYNHPDAEKYDRIAVAKAVVSKKTGLPSRQVQQEAPHLYLPGMTKWGGAVIRNGLVVAFSGVQAVYDEAIAWSMLAWVEAMCRNEMTRPGGVMASDDSFLGDPTLPLFPSVRRDGA